MTNDMTNSMTPSPGTKETVVSILMIPISKIRELNICHSV